MSKFTLLIALGVASGTKLSAAFIGNEYTISVTDSGVSKCGTVASSLFGSFNQDYIINNCVVQSSSGPSFQVTAVSSATDFLAQAWVKMEGNPPGTWNTDGNVTVSVTSLALDTLSNTLGEPVDFSMDAVIAPPYPGFSGVSGFGSPGIIGQESVSCDLSGVEQNGPTSCNISGTIPAYGITDVGVGLSTSISVNQLAFAPAVFTEYQYWPYGGAQVVSVTVTDTQGQALSPSVLELSNGTPVTSAGYVPEPQNLGSVAMALLVCYWGFRRLQRAD